VRKGTESDASIYFDMQHIDSLILVARASGEILCQYFRKHGYSHAAKSGRANLVTEVDLESQRMIVRELSNFFLTSQL